MKFKTSYNLSQFPKPKGEYNTTPSMTIPSQSMSIPEILRRHQSGLSTTGQKISFYEETDGEGMTTEEFRRMDLADQEQYINHRRQELADIKSKRVALNNKLRELDQARLDKITAEAREEAVNRLTGGKNQQGNPADSTK